MKNWRQFVKLIIRTNIEIKGKPTLAIKELDRKAMSKISLLKLKMVHWWKQELSWNEEWVDSKGMVKLDMIFLFSVQGFFDPFATEYHFAVFSYSIMDMLFFNIYQLLI